MIPIKRKARGRTKRFISLHAKYLLVIVLDGITSTYIKTLVRIKLTENL